MKLFKLPFLCQKEVFAEMAFSTRYIFTFGTRRMKIWAKRLQKTLKSPELQTEIINAVDIAFSVKSGKRVEKIMDLTSWWPNRENIRVMKFSDLELKCEITFTPNMLIKHSLLLSPTPHILESLCDFFNITKQDIIYILHDYSSFTGIPSFPIQKSVLQLMNGRFNSDWVHHVYLKNPDQQFSMIQAERNFLKLLPNNFQMLRTRNLILRSIGLVDTFLMTDFRGENAVICGVKIEISTINSFLKSWLNWTSDDLKTMIVEVTDPIQGNDIFGEILHTKKKESVLYPYSSIIQDYYDFPEGAFDCSNTYSITKHAITPMEKKATVKLTTHSFMFFVWD